MERNPYKILMQRKQSEDNMSIWNGKSKATDKHLKTKKVSEDEDEDDEFDEDEKFLKLKEENAILKVKLELLTETANKLREQNMFLLSRIEKYSDNQHEIVLQLISKKNEPSAAMAAYIANKNQQSVVPNSGIGQKSVERKDGK